MATTDAVEETTVELPLEVQQANHRLAFLEATNKEYQVTIRVLAVVVERLLERVGGEVIVITDEMLENSPNLDAGREEELHQVWIKVSR
jgi:hypothetical protein